MAYIGVSPSNGVRRVHTYTATASQTTFSGAGAEGTSLSYKDSNFVDVYQNGIKLGDADYTSTSGTSIVLAQGASVDDLVVVVVFDVFSVADTVSKADGGTFDGNVTMGGTLDVTGAITSSAGATITTADNNAQLTLISTDADANRGPILALTRNSGSPADNDIGGTIKFNAKNDASEDIELFEINTTLTDASDSTEDAKMTINGIIGGASTNRLNLTNSETVFNDDSVDIDFRVESDNDANAFFVEGSSGSIGIGTSSPVASSGGKFVTIETTADENTNVVFNTANTDRAGIIEARRTGRSGAERFAQINLQNSSDIGEIIFYTAASGYDVAQRAKIGHLGDLYVQRVYNNTTSSGANVFIASDGQFLRSTSSQRYKNTINDATHGLTELLTLRPVTYKGNHDNDGDTIFGGLIAEEVHDAGLTEFVQYNEDNEPDALAYGNMVSLCIKAIQELKTELDNAKARITALENSE
jgi:hypothetical protein